MKRRDIPNLLTVGRMLLTVPIVFFILNDRYADALLLVIIAGMSDGLDGYLAKRNHWSTRLGAVLDPLADKLLLMSVYLALGWQEALPVWLVSAVLLRDIVILLGAGAYWSFVGSLEMAPRLASKVNTALLILLALATVITLGVTPLPPWLLNALTFGVALTTAVSGLDYVMTWSRRAIQARAHRHVS